MNLPKFLLCDNISYKDGVFVLHTNYPRFIINIMTDEIEWFEQIDNSETILAEASNLVEEALNFYDNELKSYNLE